jgi:uncharacterized small protein (TIGR04563 family)
MFRSRSWMFRWRSSPKRPVFAKAVLDTRARMKLKFPPRQAFSERGGPMGGSDKRKQSLYFPEEMLKEIQEEATRQDRSLSWIVQKAWKISRKEIMKYPSVNEFPGEEDERGAVE